MPRRALAGTRILLADRDPQFRRRVAEHLRGEGCSCRAGATASEARAAARSKDFQLVILDTELPGARGLELLREITQF